MAPKTVPRRVQDEVKIIAKFWSLSGTVLGRFLTPSWAPRRLQNRPKIRPRAFKIPPRISKTTRGPPRSLQTLPGPPPMTSPGPPPGPQNDRFRSDFATDLGSNSLVLKPPARSFFQCRKLFYQRRVRVGACPEGQANCPKTPPDPPRAAPKRRVWEAAGEGRHGQRCGGASIRTRDPE